MNAINRLNRNGAKKRKLRNLIKRGRIWYWKKMTDGKTLPVSLKTDNEALAFAKRDQLEADVVSGALARLREVKQAATLAEIFAARDEIGGITDKALKGTKWALLAVCRTVLNDDALTAEKVSLGMLNAKVARDFQDKFRARYEAEAGANDKARRKARDRADLSSMSLLKQARSLFAKKRQLPERYREKGLLLPAGVKEFCECGLVGKMSSKVYMPPSDVALAQTFVAIEGMKETDRELYDLFWAVVAIGGRRNEALDIQAADLMEVNGALWLNGGSGKDGETIQLPLINWPVHPSSATIPAQVVRELWKRERVGTYLFGESQNHRQDVLPKRTNAWLKSQGWLDEKKLHAVRAFVGSVLYNQNPKLAQRYLRHKSISTTEKFYTHFLELTKVTQLRVVAPHEVSVRTGGQAAT